MGATGLQVSAGSVPAGVVGACVAAVSLACVSVASAADTTATTPPSADVAAAPTTFGAATTQGNAHTNFLTYGADAGVGYTDNIAETSVNQRSEEMVEVGAQLAGYDQSSRFVGAMLGDLEHVNYLQGTYSPQVIGNFGGYASYALLPDFIHWMAQDSFGQGLVDPFASQSPGNLENINTITTGPTFTIPLSALTLLDISARYSRVSYQVSPLDNNEYGGSLSLTHLLSARSRFSVVVQDERYDYTDPINPSYNQREAFLRYDIQGSRTHIAFDAGYDQVRGDQVNTSGFLGRFSASRNLAAGSMLFVSVGRDPSSSSQFLTQNQTASGIASLNATPGRQTATPFINEYETLGWTFNRRRTQLGVTLSHYAQIFDGQSALDQTISSAGVNVSRMVSPGWTVTLFGDYSKQTFADQPGNYTEKHEGLNVRWQLARKLRLAFEYDHHNRNGDLALYSYSENRVWMRVQYGTGAPGTSTGGFSGSASDSTQTPVMSGLADPFNIPMPSH